MNQTQELTRTNVLLTRNKINTYVYMFVYTVIFRVLTQNVINKIGTNNEIYINYNTQIKLKQCTMLANKICKFW